MGIYGRLTGKDGVRGRSKVLSGKNEQDEPLADHTHAYYLPSDEDGDGRLDHLTVFASAGFGRDERRAFDLLREVRTGREGEERQPLRVVLLGMGASTEYSPGPLQSSRQWVSATPYIATRYAKTRGQHRIDLGWPEQRENFLRDNLRSQLVTLWPELFGELAPEVVVEPEWDPNHVFQVARRWRSIQFKRYRRKRGDDGGRRLSGAYRLTFAFPVRGPIALGYSSHFGMGFFMPANGNS
jgi:CRISPR-associated protein Csb2